MKIYTQSIFKWQQWFLQTSCSVALSECVDFNGLQIHSLCGRTLCYPSFFRIGLEIIKRRQIWQRVYFPHQRMGREKEIKNLLKNSQQSVV